MTLRTNLNGWTRTATAALVAAGLALVGGSAFPSASVISDKPAPVITLSSVSPLSAPGVFVVSATTTNSDSSLLNPGVVSGPCTATGIAASGPYASAILAGHPLAYWRLEEGSGDGLILRDATDPSSGHAAWLASETGITRGVAGALADASHGLGLDGTHDANGATFDTIMTSSAQTLEFWFRPQAGANSYQALIADGVTGPELFYDQTTQTIGYDYFMGAGFSEFRNNTPLTPGALHHVAVTVDASGTITIYVDGQADGASAAGEFDWSIAGNHRISQFFGDTFDGDQLSADLIDEIAVYSIALTADQVAADHALGGVSSLVFQATNFGVCVVSASGAETANFQAATASTSVTIASANHAPSCIAAAPTVISIRPANHQMVPVGIAGVTDADGDALTIKITSIFQDEPINGVADGDTAPDGAGVGTSLAQVRAERAGSSKVPGNGRVYTVSFSANDGHGGTCTGRVRVGVPFDGSSANAAAIDDGAIYDSLTGAKKQ
jgi:hypothetical protein